MKLSTLCLSTSIALSSLAGLTSISAHAIDLSSMAKSSSEQLQTAAKEITEPLQTNAMIQYAANQLNMSETTVSAGLGSLLKVAQDNLSEDNFALISKAMPDAQNYVDKAPSISTSSLGSLFSSGGDASKAASSMDYLTSAFSSLGMSADDIPGLANTLSLYLESNGYSEAASMLKQGLSFL